MTFFILNFIFGQSPFNYGQNEKVYFVSTDLRNKLEIKTIYTAEKNFMKNNDGTGQNWNVTALSFDTNNVTDYMGAIALNSTFNFNCDSLTPYLHNGTGTRYELANGKLVNYGGGTTGNYYWTLITRFSDTVSIVASCANGAVFDAVVNYSKNIFDKQDRKSTRLNSSHSDRSRMPSSA